MQRCLLTMLLPLLLSGTLWMAGAGGISAAAVGAEELPLRDTAAGKVFGTERFAVRLDPLTGWAGDVLCDGRCVVAAAETKQVLDLKVNDAWLTGSGTAIVGRGVERVGLDTIRSQLQIGDWSIAAYVQVFPDQRLLRRWFEITWEGTTDCKMRGFWWQGGQLSLGTGGGYFYPAQYPPKRTAAGDLVAGRKTHTGRSPFPVVADRGDGWSAIWLLDESPSYSDRGSTGVTEGAESLRVTQSFDVLGHARRGVTQKVGDAWLWLQPSDADSALGRMPEWFRFVHQLPPADRPEWLNRVILYSFHPGGTIGSQCRDLGGFRPATELLPHVQQLGCNAIWLMPLEDKSIYWPRDYYRFQEGLGTPQDYRTLTAQAHALGLRVWQDCVPHGGSNKFPRAQEHPEWLAQNEDGSTLDYWCFDFNWPTWIEYMRDVVTFYTREYGLDGFRIDACGGSKIPNWNPAIPYARASHAQAQGGLAMQRALRQAVKAIRPDGANLAEVGASIHGTVSDSTYDFSLCYDVLHDFRKVPAEVFVPRLRRWLHEQQCAEVPDLVRMRHLESHDSLRSGLWYGAEPQRALTALLAWIHGIPLVYHEMEDGHFDVYRQIFHVRRHVTELNGGAADYLSVQAPDGVFACLRTGSMPPANSPAWHADYAWDTSPTDPARASLVLVNLDGRTVLGNVSLPLTCLPESLRQAQIVRDLTSGESLLVRRTGAACEITTTLPPFAYTVLRFDSNPLPTLAPVAERTPTRNGSSPEKPVSMPWQLTTNAGEWRINPDTGLASVWQRDGRTQTAIMDLALPAKLAKAGAKAVGRKTSDGVEVRRSFGSHTLALRYTVSAEAGVEVRGSWEGGVPEGAAIVWHVADAAAWEAQAAEGHFASPFRVRHPQFDGVIGSIYRLPQGTAVTWDSRLHPFGLSRDQAWVGATSAADRRTVLSFAPDCLPAYVQLLDRVGESHGLKVLMAWQSDECGVSWGSDELRFQCEATAPAAAATERTSDARLRLVGGGWEFDNALVRARIARTGTLTGLWRKRADGWRQVLRHGGLYTDKGFGEGIRYAQENDVEASVRLERHGAHIRLTVCGELRGFQRFDKLAHPLHFYTVYTFGDGPTFQYASAVEMDPASTAKSAFLSLLLKTNGLQSMALADANGQYLTGQRQDGGGRFAQLAQSATPQRLPTDIRLTDADGVMLRLGAMTWFGARPGNVFMHGEDLHLAWLDGSPDAGAAGTWRGVMCSVACEDTLSANPDLLPRPQMVKDQPAELLRDGGFEMANASGTVLLSCGQSLPQASSKPPVWSLPPGAEYVVEDGNRCVLVTGDGLSYRLIRQAVPAGTLNPGSKWRLSARLKGSGVQAGDVGWKTACLRWSVSVGGRTTYTTLNLPQGDSPWRNWEVLLTVPEGVEQVAVEAGLNGNPGQMWIDDVHIEAADGPSHE